MIGEEANAGFDFGTMRDAIERRDPETLEGFYDQDAELRVVNAAAPDGRAFRLRGKAEIGRYLRAMCLQRTSCVVEGEAQGEERVLFTLVCNYLDGSRISVETTLEIRAGMISSQLDKASSPRVEGRDPGSESTSHQPIAGTADGPTPSNERRRT
jgi:hypothetical protein